MQLRLITGPTGASSCSPYHCGDTGPDGGIVFFVDGSGCHGLEAQATEANQGAIMDWDTAISTSAAYNTTTITGPSGLYCSTTALPSPDAPPATLNCWHLPTKTELEHLNEQRTVVGGFDLYPYWSSSESATGTAWAQGFVDGGQFSNDKALTFLVRAVRAF